MLLRDIFETKIEEKIDPVIKVGERHNEKKLAGEIGSYVVTPTLEKFLDDFLEHYTDTFRKETTEIGVWISGYFGSGKSHLAKIFSLLVENPTLDGISAAKRFEARLPSQASSRSAILRSLSQLNYCDTQAMAFNINTLADSKKSPLPRLLLSQFYLSKGYGANFLYARVIEAELDKRGKLPELHAAAERFAKKAWADIQNNPAFFSRALYQAACEVAPDIFTSVEEVARSLKSAENGELYNTQFLIQTILDDIKEREKKIGKPCRFIFVLDESGQWIEDDAGRLSQLQALVEEAAVKGQGKIWAIVTTHESMGTIYLNALALQADMKKIESRFRLKCSLTTENIELVLEDRIFRKNLAGKTAVTAAYNENPGVLRDLGELKSDGQKLPPCSEERFTKFYPFLPYQIHLIPDIVKSLRSSGGRGEQLSGSTRTLLAITQDILRSGRRDYLDCGVGELVSFDEVYGNLAGEGEVSPDARRELSRIEEVVPDASALTRRVAEVLYLIRELSYIPRTLDNLARLMVEHTDDDLAAIINHMRPELERLEKAHLVAKIGEEYEFLTGERRTFEEEVADDRAGIKMQDMEIGLSKLATSDILGFSTILYKGNEFATQIFFDDKQVTKDGSVQIRVSSPLSALGGIKVTDLEDTSLRPDEQSTIFVLCDRIAGFDDNLKYYLAMQSVIGRWKGDPHKSEPAHKLAHERESNDLDKLRRKVLDGIQDGLRHAQVIFRGSSRVVFPKIGQTPGEALRTELATFWPNLYSKFDRVPVRIINEQHAIVEVLTGVRNLSSDVVALNFYEKGGQIDLNAPLLDAIRVFLSTRQGRNERTLGKELLAQFASPPYGWDPNCVRVGVAALVRAGSVKILIDKKPYTNPADSDLQIALRVSGNFNKIELVLEDTDIDPDTLTAVRKILIALTGIKKIDETPAALADAFSAFAAELLGKAQAAATWAEPAALPLPERFKEGRETYGDLQALNNPLHRVKELNARLGYLVDEAAAIRQVDSFVGKWGKTYIEMRRFAQALQPLDFRLPAGGTCQSFLNNWQTATQAASVVDAEVWKDLQNSKAAAELELEQCKNAWRNEAQDLAQKVIDQLAYDQRVKEIFNEAGREALIEPLQKFITDLQKETRVETLANAPGRIEYLYRQIVQLVEEAWKKKQAAEQKPVKPIETIRLSEVLKITTIQTASQWDEINQRLDQTVRQALDQGHEVRFE
jgi:hypothetical protein